MSQPRRVASLIRLAAPAMALVMVAVACGDDGDQPIARSGGITTTPATDATTTTAAEASARALTLVAKDIAFDQTELSVPVGADVTVTFDNQDEGIPHNLRVDGPETFATDIENGPVTQELKLRIDEPGTFTYVCDVHPNEMEGALTAE